MPGVPRLVRSWARGLSSSSGTFAAEGKDASSAGEGSNGGDTAGTPAEGDVDAGDAEAARASSADELQAALDAMQAALAEEQRVAAELKDKTLRTLADMENLRERTARQLATQKAFATDSLLKSLLEVADNLERAAAAVPEAVLGGKEEVDAARALTLLRSLREGVVMTDTILQSVFRKEGLTKYDPLGEAFDPNFHSALMEVQDPSKPPRTVAIVIKKGYRYEDRALRAADVGVVAARPDAE